ncbi:UNVERIFIED_CONTAM: hypothetical protein FKN15_002139 [Acipenser sinensis]
MRAPRYRSTGEDTTQSAYPDRVVNTHTWSAQSVYQGGTRPKPRWVKFFSKNVTLFIRRKENEREYTERTRTDSPQRSGSAGGSAQTGIRQYLAPRKRARLGHSTVGIRPGLAPRRILV